MLAGRLRTLEGVRQRERWASRLSGGEWRVVATEALALVAVWVVAAVPASVLVFLNSERESVVASHDAVILPTLNGYATLDLGPFLPDVRVRTGSTVGARVDFGKTNQSTYEGLVRRYAVIASRPEGETAKLRATLVDMGFDAGLRGAMLGLVLPTVWLLLGRRRRDELFHHVTWRRVGATGAVTALAAVAVAQPWNRPQETVEDTVAWESIQKALPEVPIPVEARAIEVQSGLITTAAKRLATSAFDTYQRSLRFYTEVEHEARRLASRLRQPQADETVAIVVSDRHDNVGMDSVVRTIAEQASASMILDAGDNTSTGEPWESFSLDSLHQAFEDYEHRFTVAGNHDNGEFVINYLANLGWTTFSGDTVEGPQGIRIFGANDPRASGLGTWRDEGDLSFTQHQRLVADAACDEDEAGARISTLLVHDANSGQQALERGCVDLVIGGHVHARLGPTRVSGANGKVGYTYTNGTTGGAAYALAIGSKLRRDAQVSLVTYRDDVPVGIQSVTIRTVGDFEVSDYVELDVDRAG